MAKKKKNNNNFLDSLDSNLDAKDQLKIVDEQFNFLKNIEKEYEKILEARRKGKSYDKDRLLEIQKEYGGLNSIQNKINDLVDAFNELSTNMPNFEKELSKSAEKFDEMDSSLASLGNMLGKNSALYEQHEQRVDNVKNTISSISAIIQKNNDLTTKDREQLTEIANAYSTQQVTIAQIQKDYAKGNLDKETAARLIEQESNGFEEIVSKFQLTGREGEHLKELLADMVNESKSFAESAQKTQSAFQAMDNVMGEFSGVPAMSQLNTLLKTNKADALALKAALFAVGAAAGKAAFDYFGAGVKVKRQVEFEIDNAQLQNEVQKIETLMAVNQGPIKSAGIGVFNEQKGKQVQYTQGPKKGQKIDTNFLQRRVDLDLQKMQDQFKNDTLPNLELQAKYAGARAGNQFAAEFQSAAAQFKAAAKTARFGEQLEAPGFNRGELQMAGIDPNQISQAMSQLAKETGKVPAAKLGSEMALIAKRTGQSVEGIASLTEFFQRADNLSSETAVNMVEGMRAMAKASNLDLANLMEGVAEASKDALSYQIMSAAALTKQVAAAQSIGVNFNKLASAGKNMVLNYKDSIKAEMELSSMMGRSVNLSEVRAKAMAGDYEGVMQAMKAQGLNPEDMNMYQQEALQKAMGGLDLDSIQKIYKGEVKTAADLKAGDAAGAGADFLKRNKQAQASLAADQAQISANAAIVDAKLSQKIAEEYTNSEDYKNLLKAQAEAAAKEAQLTTDIGIAVKSLKEYQDLQTQISQREQEFSIGGALMDGLVGTVSGLATTALSGLAEKGIGKLFGGTPDVTPSTTPGVTPSTATKTPSNTVQQAAKIKAANPGMTSQQALQQAKATTPSPAAPKPTAPKPSVKPKKGFFKGTKGKAGLILGGLTLLGGVISSAMAGGKSDEAEAAPAQNLPQENPLSADQLAQQVMQTKAMDEMNSQMAANNNLLKNANGELVDANKSNVLSGICSCIASNMQSNMGMMLEELKTLKEAYSAAYDAKYKDGSKAIEEQQGTNLASVVGTTIMGGLTDTIMNTALGAGTTLVTETALPALKNLAVKQAAQKAPVMGMKEVLTSAGKGAFTKAGVAGLVGGAVSVGGEYLKTKAVAEADDTKYEMGRAASVAGDVLSYASMGAMIAGPVGAAVGGALGGLYSIYSNYFSADAQKQAEAVEKAEKERLAAEALNAQINALISIQETAVASANKTMQDTNNMLAIAGDEKMWRASMLLQTVEMTRLLSIISSGFVTRGEGGVVKDKLGNVVEEKSYDQLTGIKASMGNLTYKDDRQKDIANRIQQFNALAGTKQTKLTIGGQQMDLEEYKKKYNVSDKDIKEATYVSSLMSQQQAKTPQVTTTGTTTTGTAKTPQVTTTGTTTTGTATTGTTTNTPTPNAGPGSISSLLPILQEIKNNDNTRGILIYTELKNVISAYLGRIELRLMAPVDLINTTLTTISTNISAIKSYMEAQQTGGSNEMNVILHKIQTEAHIRGISMYVVENKQQAELQKIITTTNKNTEASQAVKGKITELYADQIPSTRNLENISIAMLNALSDAAQILVGIEENTRIQIQNGNSINLSLDSDTLSNAIVRTNTRKTGFSQSRRLVTKGG